MFQRYSTGFQKGSMEFKEYSRGSLEVLYPFRVISGGFNCVPGVFLEISKSFKSLWFSRGFRDVKGCSTVF